LIKVSHESPGQLPATIMVRLSEFTSQTPDRIAYTFLREGEQAAEQLSFAELSARVTAFAARLTGKYRAGERLILLYPQGLDFLVAFLGCLKCGVVAVPVSLPNRHRGVTLLRAIALDCQASALLSERALLERLEASLVTDSVLQALPRFSTEDWRDAPVKPGPLPDILGSSTALIQYTSGSTGTPRGVLVSHANLVHNQRQIQETCGYGVDSVAVSWLPLFHDMGLGVALMTVSAGMRGVLMSPSAFLQKPIRWLRAISDYRATFSSAPDFGYDLCARRVSPIECEGLDLSSWTIAPNGSEPVRAATFERFVTAFAPYGFRGENYKPVYGLAEATLLVTGDAPGRAPTVRRFSTELLEQGKASVPRSSEELSRAFIGCGQPRSGAGICIVDPQSLAECDAGTVGEIWVSGPSVAGGYWGLDAISEATFRARTADGRGPFLRTGDLGFWDDDSLFITGRIKDLVIIRGRNHYPQDIEATVSMCHPALEPQRCAAFSVDGDEGEQLVVVQEVRRSALRSLDTAEVFRAISSAVSRGHGLQTHSIVLIRPGSLPKTTSGKVQRKPCTRAFLEHSLNEIAAWGSAVANGPESDSMREPGGPLSASAAHLMAWLGEELAATPDAPFVEGQYLETSAEFAAALEQHGALALRRELRHGGLGLNVSESVSVLEQIGELDLKLAHFVGISNAKQAAASAAAPRTDKAELESRLALAAVSVGGLKRCEQLARRHSPYFGRALRKKLTPDPEVLAKLGALASRVVALASLVQRTAQVLDAGGVVPEEIFVVCQIASSGMLRESLNDLLMLAATGSDTSDVRHISRLEHAVAALWQPDAAIPEVTSRLGTHVLSQRQALTELPLSLSANTGLMPLVVRAAHSVGAQVERIKRTAAGGADQDSAQQLGALTSWLALLTAAEATRQEAPTPDLDRASTWIRSQLEFALAALRSGEAGESPGVESRDPAAARSLAFSDAAEAAEASGSALRTWLISWVSRRMRIPEAQVAPSRAFADYGLDSVAAVELAKALSDKLGFAFDDTLLWNFPTIDSLVDFVVSARSQHTRSAADSSSQGPDTSRQTEGDDVERELARLEAELKRRA
jgi:acyl-CoA synthetase (AMP-forming)/AMP-acid ligase II/acyl carrier protein